MGLVLAGCSHAVADGPPEGFVRLADVAPQIVQEIRYAGDHNFVGRPITGYDAAECWLTEQAAQALAQAAATVQAQGYGLKVYDCYRPQRAVDDFVAWAQDPDDDLTRAEFYPRLAKDVLFPQGYIAERSGHSRGSTVDVTLIPLGAGVSPPWQPGDPLVDCTAARPARFPDTSIDMGTGFDCFDPLAATESSEVTEVQQANRRILLDAMTEAGFVNLPGEWWHYTLAHEPFPETFFDVPITPGPMTPSWAPSPATDVALAEMGDQTPAPGDLVTVPGLPGVQHLDCRGPEPEPGEATAIVFAGAGDFSLSWHQVADLVASDHRICTYDRPGLGWSTPSDADPLGSVVVADAQALVQAAGVQPPWVIVGHSMGAVYARSFAAAERQDVAAVVLVDPGDERLDVAIDRAAREALISAVQQRAGLLEQSRQACELGIYARDLDQLPLAPNLPASDAATLQRLQASACDTWAATAREGLTAADTWAEARAADLGPLGDIPLVVILSDGDVPLTGVPDLDADANVVWRALQREQAGLSPQGVVVVAEGSTHSVMLDRPDVVAEAINRVWP